MESTRQLKVGKLILKELGEIFQREGKPLIGNAFVTITKVKVSPDLSLAKVYFSLMLVENKKEFLESLAEQHNNKAIRKMLGERIRKQVRIIPHLNFYLDDNLDYAAKMDEIFSKIVIPPSPTSDKEGKDEEE